MWLELTAIATTPLHRIVEMDLLIVDKRDHSIATRTFTWLFVFWRPVTEKFSVSHTANSTQEFLIKAQLNVDGL